MAWYNPFKKPAPTPPQNLPDYFKPAPGSPADKIINPEQQTKVPTTPTPSRGGGGGSSGGGGYAGPVPLGADEQTFRETGVTTVKPTPQASTSAAQVQSEQNLKQKYLGATTTPIDTLLATGNKRVGGVLFKGGYDTGSSLSKPYTYGGFQFTTSEPTKTNQWKVESTNLADATREAQYASQTIQSKGFLGAETFGTRKFNIEQQKISKEFFKAETEFLKAPESYTGKELEVTTTLEGYSYKFSDSFVSGITKKKGFFSQGKEDYKYFGGLSSSNKVKILGASSLQALGSFGEGIQDLRFKLVQGFGFRQVDQSTGKAKPLVGLSELRRGLSPKLKNIAFASEYPTSTFEKSVQIGAGVALLGVGGKQAYSMYSAERVAGLGKIESIKATAFNVGSELVPFAPKTGIYKPFKVSSTKPIQLGDSRALTKIGSNGNIRVSGDTSFYKGEQWNYASVRPGYKIDIKTLDTSSVSRFSYANVPGRVTFGEDGKGQIRIRGRGTQSTYSQEIVQIGRYDLGTRGVYTETLKRFTSLGKFDVNKIGGVTGTIGFKPVTKIGDIKIAEKIRTQDLTEFGSKLKLTKFDIGKRGFTKGVLYVSPKADVITGTSITKVQPFSKTTLKFGYTSFGKVIPSQFGSKFIGGRPSLSVARFTGTDIKTAVGNIGKLSLGEGVAFGGTRSFKGFLNIKTLAFEPKNVVRDKGFGITSGNGRSISVTKTISKFAPPITPTFQQQTQSISIQTPVSKIVPPIYTTTFTPQRTQTKVKNVQISSPSFTTATTSALASATKSASVLIPATDLRTKTRQGFSPAIAFKSTQSFKTPTITIQRSITKPVGSFYPSITTPTGFLSWTPTPPIITIPFVLPFGGEGFGFGGDIKASRRYKYTPSFKAIVFNIRGKQPKKTRFTGLEIRPIQAGSIFRSRPMPIRFGIPRKKSKRKMLGFFG